MRGTKAPLPEFTGALDRANRDPSAPQPKCLGDTSYVDYEVRPSEEVAKEMCSNCPLIDLCLSSAKWERPAWGVRGGIVWDEGRQYHWRVKRGFIEPESTLTEAEAS